MQIEDWILKTHSIIQNFRNEIAIQLWDNIQMDIKGTGRELDCFRTASASRLSQSSEMN
jgi:hypothetical protein